MKLTSANSGGPQTTGWVLKVRERCGERETSETGPGGTGAGLLSTASSGSFPILHLPAYPMVASSLNMDYIIRHSPLLSRVGWETNSQAYFRRVKLVPDGLALRADGSRKQETPDGESWLLALLFPLPSSEVDSLFVRSDLHVSSRLRAPSRHVIGRLRGAAHLVIALSRADSEHLQHSRLGNTKRAKAEAAGDQGAAWA